MLLVLFEVGEDDCEEKFLLVVALPAAAEPVLLLNETDIFPSCFELRPLKVNRDDDDDEFVVFVELLSADPVGSGGGGGGGCVVDDDVAGFVFVTLNGDDTFGFFNIDFISTTDDDDDDDVNELFRLELIFGLLLGTSREKLTLFLPVVGALALEEDAILEYDGESFLLVGVSDFDFLGGRFGMDVEDGILDVAVAGLTG